METWAGRIALFRATVWLTMSNLWRYPLLWANVALGRLQGITRRGWWPFLTTLALVIVILIVGPKLLHVAELGLKEIDVTDVDPAPEVKDWLSLLNVVLLMIVVLFVRWIGSARTRVVVEGFVDFTKDNATAVSGLSTLLVTELGRLRELYNQVDDISVPTAVGVEQHGGFGRGKEAASFLTVSADDVTDVLEGAIASDARIEMGPAKIPIGPVLAFFNRLTRGPRLTGSVHLTEAGGGPTLTAQLIGKDSSGTWRVDQPREPESPEQRKAFLDSMVRELACRMFTQLTLRGSVRWQAVEAFNEYLRLYGDSRRTPRDRGRFLKRAQAKLLEAVAEDERFDLAYYNLGVIYTQLAQTERLADQESDDATSRADFQREELDAARREAARVAFLRAAAQNPNRWEAYYAQAVTRFSQIKHVDIDERLDPDDPEEEEDKKRVDELHAVIALCDQTLAVLSNRDPTAGSVYDLRGMAQVRLAEDFPAALESHRKAVRHSWMEYCRARRHDRAHPTGQPHLAERACANATAALHNLALAYERHALIPGADRGDEGDRDDAPDRDAPDRPDPRELTAFDRLDLTAAARIFRWAGRLAGEGNKVGAACHFERGRVLERLGRFQAAADEFRDASRVIPRSCEYRASRARALAKEAARLKADERADDEQIEAVRDQAERTAKRALKLLAKPFSLAVIPFTADTLDLECTATLSVLEGAYEALGDKDEAERMEGIRDLRETVEAAMELAFDEEATAEDEEPPSVWVLHELEAELGGEVLAGKPRDWELDQIELALGRAHADAEEWDEARETFKPLMEQLQRTDRRDRIEFDLQDRIIEFGLYPHLARAQRECGEYVAALKTAAESVRRDPLNVEGRREAGRAHFALGQYSDALGAWEHALWLSPSDPYLHYEVAMCHRAMARDRTDKAECERLIACAEGHFSQAQELFDGEDLGGEAWTRFWRGKIALEAERPVEALALLQGAEHGTATAAAALLVGEAHLALDQRPEADHAFKRCEAALGRKKETARLKGRTTIDALWGDELPEDAVRARILRGSAEATCLAPGEWQDPKMLSKAMGLLAEARKLLDDLEDAAPRDRAMTRVLDTESRVLAARGDIAGALDRVRRRLRYRSTPDARALEAELLDLRAEQGKRIDKDTLIRLAADHTWEAVKSNGRPRRRRRRRQVARA